MYGKTFDPFSYFNGQHIDHSILIEFDREILIIPQARNKYDVESVPYFMCI